MPHPLIRNMRQLSHADGHTGDVCTAHDPARQQPASPRALAVRLRGLAAFMLLAVPACCCPAATLEAHYDPVSGNLSMQAVDDNGDPTSLAINGFQFLSDTNMLSGDTALFPPAPVGSGIYFKTSNRDFGVFGIDSEIFAVDSNQVAIFDGTWDLGDVAAPNMTQADLLTNFTTDAASTPGGSAVAGGYLYWVVGDAGYTLGSIVAVPEPATFSLALSAVCGLLCCRQFTAARTSVLGKSSPLKSNASLKATAAA